MRGTKDLPVEHLRGLERDGNPIPRDRDPSSAYIAKNVRIGNTQGTVERFGGRAKIYTSVYAGGFLPAHVLGLTEARLGASDYLIVAASNSTPTQSILSLTYAANVWSAADITGAYAPNCPVARRFSFAVLNDLLVMSDYGNHNLQKWNGAGNTATLTTTGVTNLKARYMTTVGGYLFLAYTEEAGTAYPSRVRWSDAGLPESYPSNFIATLSDKDGDICMGLTALQNFVVAYKRNSIWVGAYVNAAVGYQFDRIVPDKGTIAPWSIVSVGNLTYSVWRDGVYFYDGTSELKKVSGKKVSQLFISGLAASEEMGYQVVAYKHPFKTEIWFCSQQSDYPTWIYNYQTDDWSYSTLKFETLSITRRAQTLTYNDLAAQITQHTYDSLMSMDTKHTWDAPLGGTAAQQLFVGGASAPDTTQAVVYEVDSGLYNDVNSSTTALTATYRTAIDDCRLPDNKKRFLGVTLTLAPFAATLTVRIFVDGAQAGADQTINISSDSADYIEKVVYFNAVGRTVQVEIEDAAGNESFRLMGHTVHYIPREAVR